MAGETIDEARTEEREEALPVPLPVAVKAGPYEAGRTAERNPFGLARVILTVDPRCMSRANCENGGVLGGRPGVVF